MPLPPNYHLAATRCCATCNRADRDVANGTLHCSWYAGMRVGRGYVCDDWQPEVA